ncbi:peptidase M76 family-domain-containing protein [Paraphysoderma sedebokerense]|nr:peptidase M76 family-domain-containing protein [Paraphysoderma sedebokerense]
MLDFKTESIPSLNSNNNSLFQRWSTKFLSILSYQSDECQPESDSSDIRILKRIQEKECQRCEKWKNEILHSNEKVKTLLKALDNLGTPFNTDKHIKCVPCDENASGGFGPEVGILLCQNRFISKEMMTDTLVHELIHAHDYSKYQYDWTNCLHHACTEIRAANLSGDCGFGREIARGMMTFRKQHQSCVKRRATLAVRYNPHCSGPGVAEKAVDSVFESCFSDHSPFVDIPPNS